MSTLFTALLIMVPAPGPDEEPTGPAPTLQYLKYVNGAFETTATVTKSEARTETIEVIVNGQKQVQARTVLVPVVVQSKMTIDAKGAEVYGIDGKKIEDATWQKALNAGAVVVVTQDGQLPQPAYRKAFRDGTLIVVLKPMPQPKQLPAVPMVLPAPKR
jgi:hypothetical protein